LYAVLALLLFVALPVYPTTFYTTSPVVKQFTKTEMILHHTTGQSLHQYRLLKIN